MFSPLPDLWCIGNTASISLVCIEYNTTSDRLIRLRWSSSMTKNSDRQVRFFQVLSLFLRKFDIESFCSLYEHSKG